MAFGDSMTEGTTSPAPTLLTLAPSDSYPYKLQALLRRAAIWTRPLSMTNEGKAGRKARDDVAGSSTRCGPITREVVLLLDGANDLNDYGEDGIPDVLAHSSE